jgi:hypothetical protein
MERSSEIGQNDDSSSADDIFEPNENFITGHKLIAAVPTFEGKRAKVETSSSTSRYYFNGTDAAT